MPKVLIADDKPTSRELIRAVLEASGYEVTEANDGVKALEAARQVRPDLIVLDIHMPHLDGFGVIDALRADTAFDATPVMALTASCMTDDRDRALAAGFDSYMSKPLPLSVLREEVRRLLTVRRISGNSAGACAGGNGSV